MIYYDCYLPLLLFIVAIVYGYTGRSPAERSVGDGFHEHDWVWGPPQHHQNRQHGQDDHQQRDSRWDVGQHCKVRGADQAAFTTKILSSLQALWGRPDRLRNQDFGQACEVAYFLTCIVASCKSSQELSKRCQILPAPHACVGAVSVH